jgi:hypothetical protein
MNRWNGVEPKKSNKVKKIISERVKGIFQIQRNPGIENGRYEIKRNIIPRKERKKNKEDERTNKEEKR